MSTVRSSALLRSLVDLNVLDNQVAGVQTLGIRVGLGVLEQRENELGGFDGPASLRDTELLACMLSINIRSLSYYASSHMAGHIGSHRWAAYAPWAVRPVLPAYLRIGTASLFCITFSR